MKSRRRALLTAATITAAATLFACSSLGTPEDQAMGNDLWTSIEGYQSWSPAPEWEGFQESKSPHGKFVKIYINSTLAESLDDPAAGSIVVKEGFSKADDGSLNAITVMQKLDTYDEDTGGWFYGRYSAKGKMSHAGAPSMCTDCHYNAGGEDFLYINDY